MQHAGVMIISGGQTGVDLAGLRAAQCLGYRTGGWAPAGYRTQAGPKPQLQKTFKLKEYVGGYSARTRKNVDASCVTLILAANTESAGTKLTITLCEELGVPYRVVMLEPNTMPGHLRYKVPDAWVQRNILEWLKDESEKSLNEYGMFTINVAGNSSTTAPGIFGAAFLFMVSLLGRLYIEGSRALGVPVDEAKIRLSQRLFDPNVAQALNDSFDYYPDLDPRNGASLLLTDEPFTKVVE